MRNLCAGVLHADAIHDESAARTIHQYVPLFGNEPGGGVHDGVASHPIKPGSPLNAPQANLISTIARGVITGNLDWPMLGVGGVVGAVLVVIDETLRRTTKGKMGLPPLGAALAVVAGGFSLLKDQANEAGQWAQTLQQAGLGP